MYITDYMGETVAYCSSWGRWVLISGLVKDGTYNYKHSSIDIDHTSQIKGGKLIDPTGRRAFTAACLLPVKDSIMQINVENLLPY
jgi:hypothetical protein